MNVCSDLCAKGLHFNAYSKCVACPNFWQHSAGNRCVDKCPRGKAFNRYADQSRDCIDLYEVFDDVAEKNQALRQINEKNLGGSLSNRLACSNTKDIRTPYSARTVSVENMQYVEMIGSMTSTS